MGVASAAACLLVAGAAASPPAEAAPGGTPGYCPDSTGVTVVIDFNELGGGIVVRCAPGPLGSDFTGLDALKVAGFSPQGTQRWGFAFICRIAGKPAPDQDLAIEGNPHYREACVDTPPAQAFWGYWYAPDGGPWTYSDRGPTNRDVIEGGFEGWSFSLNHTQGGQPEPGIAPKRPPQQPPTQPPSSPPPTHSPTHQPPSHQPPTHPTNPPSTSPAPTTPTATSAAPTTATPSATTTKPAASTGPASGPTPTDDPGSNPVAAGHNDQGEPVSGVLPSDSDPPSSMTRGVVLGLAVIALLALGGGFTAWRRRQQG